MDKVEDEDVEAQALSYRSPTEALILIDFEPYQADSVCRLFSLARLPILAGSRGELAGCFAKIYALVGRGQA
jgi:hypothetical protein